MCSRGSRVRRSLQGGEETGQEAGPGGDVGEELRAPGCERTPCQEARRRWRRRRRSHREDQRSAGEAGGRAEAPAGSEEAGRREARPSPPRAAALWAHAGPAHNTSHVCATHPPRARAGGARAGGRAATGSLGRRLRGRPGPGPRAESRPQADAARGSAGGRAARGGACRWGWRRKRGEGPVQLAASLGRLFTPGGGALTRRAGGREGKPGAGSAGRGAGAGRTEGLRKVPGPPRSWKGPAEAALENLFLGLFFFWCVCVEFSRLFSFPSSRLHPLGTHTHELVKDCPPGISAALKNCSCSGLLRAEGCAYVLLGVPA